MHELAVTSGFSAAYRLGAKYPFSGDEGCERLFKLYLAASHGVRSVSGSVGRKVKALMIVCSGPRIGKDFLHDHFLSRAAYRPFVKREEFKCTNVQTVCSIRRCIKTILALQVEGI